MLAGLSRTKEAVSTLKDYLTNSGADARAEFQLGQLLADSGSTDEAIKAYIENQSHEEDGDFRVEGDEEPASRVPRKPSS